MILFDEVADQMLGQYDLRFLCWTREFTIMDQGDLNIAWMIYVPILSFRRRGPKRMRMAYLMVM